MSTRLNTDPVMLSLFHSTDERFSLWKNHRLTGFGASKFRNSIHGIEAKQRDEFYFAAVFAKEQFRATVTVDVSCGDARKNLFAQQFFVSLRVFRFRPSMPNACNHRSSLFMLMLVILIVLDRFVSITSRSNEQD